MICKECSSEPIAKGIKLIKCKYCKKEELTNVLNKNICNDCSVDELVCQKCGKTKEVE